MPKQSKCRYVIDVQFSLFFIKCPAKLFSMGNNDRKHKTFRLIFSMPLMSQLNQSYELSKDIIMRQILRQIHELYNTYKILIFPMNFIFLFSAKRDNFTG